MLAANRLADALSPTMRAGANRLLAAFLDPAERQPHENWAEATASADGQLRAGMGRETDDPRMVELVGELPMSSERFRQLWARQDVVAATGEPVVPHHPNWAICGSTARRCTSRAPTDRCS